MPIVRVKAHRHLPPQFYPIPENDRCWERALQSGQRPPRRTSFSGTPPASSPCRFRFLRSACARSKAGASWPGPPYGIHAFAIIIIGSTAPRMGRPFNEVLQSGNPISLMLCWANENWARVWDGRYHTIMCKQEYSEQDHVDHVRSVILHLKIPVH